MRIETEIKLGFKDVLIRPKRSATRSRAEVSLERTFTFKHSNKIWNGVPIIASNMDTVATFDMAVALSKHKMLTAIHKHYSEKEWDDFLEPYETNNNLDIFNYIMTTTGTGEKDIEKTIARINRHPNIEWICLDIANGYSEHFVETLKTLRKTFPAKTIVAGNIVTSEMAEELILSGADIVKTGIGGGSVCTTRVQTGVGYPQLSATIETADASHGLNGHVVSDGGCKIPGDVAKAFCAGADFVMLGGILAAHDECNGEIIEKDGKKYCKFRGMSSRSAMEKHSGGVAKHRAPEGKSVQIPYRGPVEATILEILGGLRSCGSYIGARKLKEFSKRTTFIRTTVQENTIYNSFSE